MRSLLTEMKWFNSAARLLDRHFVNKGSLDLSKEVLWGSVDQGAAELLVVTNLTGNMDQIWGNKYTLPSS